MKNGTLYLLPVPISEGAFHTLPDYLRDTIFRIDDFIVERAKTARHFLRDLGHPRPLPEINVLELDKHREGINPERLLAPLLAGRDTGLLSEAGCPGIADPGAEVVQAAHARGIPVRPLVGPSSFLLALMASGLTGQAFSFHGYLPRKIPLLARKLRELERTARKEKSSQIFMDTPYRNLRLLEVCLKELAPATRLCIAADLTGADEYIRSQPVAEWRKHPLPDLHKIPAVFIIG